MATKIHLDRFLQAQKGVYEIALAEISTGRKKSHWMWFIFPQIEGLGHSEMAIFFAIKNQEEALEYLMHPVLGQRLKEISHELLKLTIHDPVQIFGSTDSLKLNSSMTLFASVHNADPVFQQVLDKFFKGRKDKRTLEWVHQQTSC